MYYDLEKKIDEYSSELFADLGLASLPEDDKADLFARLEDHLHRVILAVLGPVLNQDEFLKIKQGIDHEDYHALDEVLSANPQYKNELEAKIDVEFNKLKLTITEEQKNAGTGTEPFG